MAVKCTLLFWGIHCVLSHFSHVWLFATLCTVALQTALSMGFSSILQNTGVGCHALLQGIFPTQRSNPSLPHCRRIFYHLSHQGSPRILEWVAYPFSRASSPPRNWTRVSCIAGRSFISWATREAHHVVEIMLNATQKMKDRGRLVFVLNCNLKEMGICMNQS